MTPPISIVSIFCEDIREEKIGTELLIGILPDNVNVPEVPGAFHKISVYTRVHLDPKSNLKRMALFLRTPSNRELPLGELKESLVSQSKETARAKQFPVAGLISRAVLAPFPVETAGIFTIIAKTSDGKEYVGGALNVQKEP